MSQILNKVRDIDPNNSDAVKDVLSTFFLNLPKHTDVDCNRWLRALENIINRFPKYCGSHRNTIETHLSFFIDSTDYYNVIEAAKCAHALQQVRPSQDKAAIAKVCWREHLNVLCNAAHKIVGALFPNSVDLYKGNPQKLQLESSASSPLCSALAQILTIPKTQNNNFNKQTILVTRLRNVFVFIQAALVEVYPVAKPVQPQLIIELIVRALSISSGVKQAHEITKSVAVKVQALRTLDALVACLGPNLIPFSGLIFKFVILTLKWCSDNLNDETREVRHSAYESLRVWLQSLHVHRPDDSRGRGGEDELTQHILSDITPAKHVVQLTMSSQPTKHLSKKAKRKLANTMLQESSISAHSSTEKNKVPLSQESNDEIAVAALDCAETFFNVCGIFLKPTTHKLFQERLVRECFNLSSYNDARALGLVRALDALRKTTPPAVPPPTQYCLQLYSDLVNSRVGEVSKFCSQALLDIRLHLHYSPPSLNFALEVQNTQKKVDQPKKMSSKNRAALEALLGAEKVPRSTAQEITFYEDLEGRKEGEPSSKKPRIEDEVADKISVSSESDVEISSDSDEVQEVAVDIADDAEDSSDDAEMDVVDAGDRNNPVTEEKSVSNDAIEEVILTRVIAQDATDNYSNETFENKTKVVSDESSPGDESREKSTDDSQDSTSKETVESSTQDENVKSVTSKDSVPVDTPPSQEESNTTDDFENIHEAPTQIPKCASIESADEPHSPRSMDVVVAYDFPNAGETKVTILEKTDEDNLPSTNDTDDVPITCGQVVKSSQELEIDNKENEVPKVNGDSKMDKTADVVAKADEKIAGIKEVTVEDMLADFVDETVEENKTEA